MSCCEGNCGCGSACKCGNGCGGCKMYPGLSNSVETSTTQIKIIDGVAPNKADVEGSELKGGGESGNGCFCNPCMCNPCNC